MQTHIDAFDIALRLFCSLIAGGMLGLNREVKGHPAGLRTLMLVCLAATLVMIEANLLLDTRLPEGHGFTTFDVLRLPLGLLSGVGMIGAGAIIHRTDAVKGVTTAATFWFATAIGLALGAGLIWLGLGVAVLGLIVLWGFRLLEEHLPHQTRVRLALDAASAGLPPDEVRARLKAAGFRIAACTVTYDGPERYALRADLHGATLAVRSVQPPPLFAELAHAAGVTKAEWSAEA